MRRFPSFSRREAPHQKAPLMFSFLFRKKKSPAPKTAVACPDCSALFSRAELERHDCICPACGKPVKIEEACGKFT